MNYKDWDPDLYLKFDKERMQPIFDLISRIKHTKPKQILDVGCGPGNSTQVLIQAFPEASFTGIDKSENMIAKARNDLPGHSWLLQDLSRETINGTFDLIFSNATIQWIPKHSKLLKMLYDALNIGGLIAIQLPLFFEIEIGKIMLNIAISDRWNSVLKEIPGLFTIHDVSFYYDELSQNFSSFHMWITTYLHIMKSHRAIYEMMEGSAFRPCLDLLPDENDKKEFKEIMINDITANYPRQRDGKVIFAIKRLFMVGYK